MQLLAPRYLFLELIQGAFWVQNGINDGFTKMSVESWKSYIVCLFTFFNCLYCNFLFTFFFQSLNPVISTSHQQVGMSYLSPFSTVITTCSSRTTSESNLSSSGYSSMASPGRILISRNFCCLQKKITSELCNFTRFLL